MNWLVTFRDANGEKCQKVFAAENRDILFNELSSKGICAIHIEPKDGQSIINLEKKHKNIKLSRRVALWGGLSILILFGTIFSIKYLIGSGKSKTEPISQQKVRKVVKDKPEVPSSFKTNAPEVVKEKEDRNSLEWLKKHDKRYIVPEDAVRRPNGRLYTKDGRRILEKLPARTIYAGAGRKQVFKHQAEREIARLLSIEPGKFFIGNANYGPRFQQSFAEAVANPTPILEDDDEKTIALKKEVNEVKADLVQRLKAGEDIVQIMKDTEKELRTLATFRNDMMKELSALRFDESVSEQDYKDFVDAANKMLKERGLKELSSPVFAEAQLKYIREVHKAKQAANEKQKDLQQ